MTSTAASTAASTVASTAASTVASTAADVAVAADSKRVRVAIIGTSGRLSGDDGKLNSELFERMRRRAARWILEDKKLNPANICLVSGGSAWADHVAVDLFLRDDRFKGAQLHLYVPSRFNPTARLFEDEQAWHTCGKTLNSLHSKFSQTCQPNRPTESAPAAITSPASMSAPSANQPIENMAEGKAEGKVRVAWSLADLARAGERGATIDGSGRGFFARNVKVGKCDYMLAFSWGTGNAPSDGGTAHTWRNSTCPSANRRHVSLDTLIAPTLVNYRRKRKLPNEE